MAINRIADGWVVMYREEGGPAAIVLPVVGMDDDGIPLLPTPDGDSAMYRRMDEEFPGWTTLDPKDAAMMSARRAKRVLEDEGYTSSNKDGFHNGTGAVFWTHWPRVEERQSGVPRTVYRHIFKKTMKPSDRAAIRRVLKL
ncbi:hypothetical protein AB0911_31265 [Streptomyces nigra]|uniref:hypothetical protein n=1 Tax=Streptomyces nigra TaxID=1827580 RepID=UPI003455B82B